MTLDTFLAGQCDATKAKYAAELANAEVGWTEALDRWYADSLVYFGLLEFRTETLYQGARVCGSRCWFRKTQKSTLKVSIPEQFQTDLFAERFAP